MVANNTSTWRMNFSAIRMASRYWPVLTCHSMSDMHAALDSSKADRTLLQLNIGRYLNKRCTYVHIR
jgi:hypothetical protein